MTRQHLALCLGLGLLVGCGSDRHGSDLSDWADAGDASSSDQGGQDSGDPDSGVATSTEECRVRLLNGDPEQADSWCRRATDGDPWQCSCDEADVVERPGSATCEEALQAACGASVEDFDSCTSEAGSCVRGENPETWRCTCPSDVTTTGEASSCADALWGFCRSGTCVLDVGACSSVADAPGKYDCECEYFDGARRRRDARLCYDALGGCVPGKDSCTQAHGFCDEASDGESAQWACSCLDGTAESRLRKTNTLDECATALEDVCGPPQDALQCERIIDDSTRAFCGTAGTPGEWLCQCETFGFEDGGAAPFPMSAGDCEAALDGTC